MTQARTALRRHIDDGVAVVLLDAPDRSMNVVDEGVLAELGEHVDALLRDSEVRAWVLASAKPGSFGAGADVSWLPQLAAREDAEAFLAGVHALMLEIARADKPLVTALNGPAYGGALELALAGHAIVGVPAASVALPEVSLGLLPGGGGTQLLRRWLPLEDALTALTTGRRLSAEQAHALGMLARVTDEEALLDAAVALARELVADGFDHRLPERGSEEDLAAVQDHAAALAGRRGGRSEAGLAAERDGFLALLRSAPARAAIHLFEVEGAIKRRSRGRGPAPARLGVVGGGQMGSGIAATAVSRGLDARVRDVSGEALERARGYARKVLERTDGEAAEGRLAAWSGTTGWDGFEDAEVVIEAVFELPELKDEILDELSRRLPAEALLASNTSAIPIRRLATAVTWPERFLGMHFFSPVDRMPLVELIPHDGTAAEARERAAAVARALGKVPVVVGDAPGFFTSRVYARWLMEGVRLLLEGAAVEDVDAAAVRAGFPVGPLQAHDEATLELVVQASITQVAEPLMADRLDVAAVRAALERLLAAGVEGRRHGSGFYRYQDGRRVGPEERIGEVLGVAPAPLDGDVLAERLLLAFATECFLSLDEGVVCHPDDGDIAAVLGIGFPRALGGPFWWADEQGAGAIVQRCRALGTAFPPGRTLSELAGSGGRLRALPRRPAPFADVAKVRSGGRP